MEFTTGDVVVAYKVRNHPSAQEGVVRGVVMGIELDEDKPVYVVAPLPRGVPALRCRSVTSPSRGIPLDEVRRAVANYAPPGAFPMEPIELNAVYDTLVGTGRARLGPYAVAFERKHLGKNVRWDQKLGLYWQP